jgi:hypothetical protein
VALWIEIHSDGSHGIRSEQCTRQRATGGKKNRTPTAFHSKAQGWSIRPTLGTRPEAAGTLKEFHLANRTWCNSFRVGLEFTDVTQGTARRRTLGFGMERFQRSQRSVLLTGLQPPVGWLPG